MAGPGRPNKLALERRRRIVLRTILKWSLESDGTVKALSKALGVGTLAIRSDLESLAEEAPESVALPADLAAEIEAAKTAEDLSRVERKLVARAAAGAISTGDLDVFVRAFRELRTTLHAAKTEAPDGKIIFSRVDRVPFTPASSPDEKAAVEGTADQRPDVPA